MDPCGGIHLVAALTRRERAGAEPGSTDSQGVRRVYRGERIRCATGSLGAGLSSDPRRRRPGLQRRCPAASFMVLRDSTVRLQRVTRTGGGHRRKLRGCRRSRGHRRRCGHRGEVRAAGRIVPGVGPGGVPDSEPHHNQHGDGHQRRSDACATAVGLGSSGHRREGRTLPRWGGDHGGAGSRPGCSWVACRSDPRRRTMPRCSTTARA